MAKAPLNPAAEGRLMLLSERPHRLLSSSVPMRYRAAALALRMLGYDWTAGQHWRYRSSVRRALDLDGSLLF
jgi:hypothetical protein